MTNQAIFCVRVSATVVEILGLLLTAWRIYFRLKIGRFWWEDAWAVFLLATGIVWVTTYWTLNSTGLISIVGGWFSSVGFTCIVASARMSVLFSIIRIIHGPPRLLKFTYACVIFFAACWTVVIVAKIVNCVLDPSWHYRRTSGRPSCLTTAQITVFQFTSDCIAVSVLVAIPLLVLWKVKLQRRKKRMILSIFASSVVLAFAALFHTVGQILDIHVVMTAGMHTMAALSIIVCNLLVVVTYTYRFLLCNAGKSDMLTESMEDISEDDDFTARARSTAVETDLTLTTVDLSASFSSPGPSIGTGSVQTVA